MIAIFKRRARERAGTTGVKQEITHNEGVPQKHVQDSGAPTGFKVSSSGVKPANGAYPIPSNGSLGLSSTDVALDQSRDIRKNWPGGTETLENLDYEARPEHRLAGLRHNHELGAEHFHLLCHRLKRLRERRTLRSLLVGSSIPKEGKTVVASNLAVALARNSGRVALIDADMRQSASNRPLGLGALPGLAEFLEGKLELSEAFRYVNGLGVYFLPAGNISRNPYELLQRPRLRELIEKTASAFEWVIFDSPPFTPFADAHSLAAATDGVLLVIRRGMVPGEILQRSLATLDGAYIAGLVLNATDDSRNEEYYSSYYGTPDRRRP